MLLCLNCNSTHPDDTVLCPVCRMKNNFKELEINPQYIPSETKNDEGKILCRNCGSMLNPAGADCCPYCRFPIKQAVTLGAKTIHLDLLRYISPPGYVAKG